MLICTAQTSHGPAKDQGLLFDWYAPGSTPVPGIGCTNLTFHTFPQFLKLFLETEYNRQGLHKFYRNIGTTSKFKTPERLHEASFTLETQSTKFDPPDHITPGDFYILKIGHDQFAPIFLFYKISI